MGNVIITEVIVKKIPSIFHRKERSSLVDQTQVNPDCQWVFEQSQVCITVKRDGTPVRYWNGGGWHQRRTLASKNGEPLVAPVDFMPVQDTPTYDDESKKMEWPGWVPLDTQYEGILQEALRLSVPLYHGCTYELCGPKVNGNPERLSVHQLFSHGVEEVGMTVPLTPQRLIETVQGLSHEGVVVYELIGLRRMAKLKRRDLGLAWPLPQ